MAIGMADYKRSIKCSGCGNEITVYMNGNFDLHELSAAGKCPQCKNTIQVDFALVEKEAPASESSYGESSSYDSVESSAMDIFSQTPSESSASDISEAVDEEEKPRKSAEEEASDMLKDLMG